MCEDDIFTLISPLSIKCSMTCTSNMKVPKPEEFVPLIDCLMGARSPPSAAAACLDRLDISTTTAEEVNECAQSDEGSNLLHLGILKVQF